MYFKRKIKYKYIKRCKGVISIFLCLILTPCMSLASALIEYSRYQGTMQTTKEVVNVSAMATMSNYDDYLLDRFGLLSMSQNSNVSAKFSNYFDRNINLLGNSVDIKNKSADGTAPLSENDIMKQQILDFSETTVLTDSLLEDFGLEDLLQKIDKSDTLSKVSDKASATVDLIDSIEELVESVESLQESITDISNKTNKVVADFGNLNTSLTECLSMLQEDITSKNKYVDNDTKEVTYTFTFKDDETEYSQTDATRYLIVKYLNNYKDIMDKASILEASVSDIANLGNDINCKIDDVKEKYNTAKDKLNKVKQSSLNDEEQETANETLNGATSIYEVIINTLDESITDAADTLKKDAINEAKNSASTIMNEISDKYHLEIDMSNVTAENITDTAINKLSELVLYMLTTENIQETIPSLISTLAIKTKDIKESVDALIKNVGNQFVNKMKNSVIGVVKSLLDTIKSMFDLDVFYNPELDANVNGDLLTQGQASSYQKLLEAIGEFFTATETFTKGVAGLDFIQALKAVKKVFVSIKKVFESICTFVSETVSNIKRLVGYVTGDVKALYEDFLVNAYMIHNLPNRTNYATGKALTGMAYSDILYKKKAQVLNPIGGILTANTVINEAMAGSGNDDMFCGSELEYILAATNSEIVNQTVAFLNIYLLRMIVDIVPIMTDTSISRMAAAASVASWVVYVLVILGEPLADTILVANGGEVPIIKKTCYLSPAGITKLATDILDVASSNAELKKVANKKIKSGIAKELEKNNFDNVTEFQDGIFKADYSKHMLLVLMFNSSPENTLNRFENLVKLEAGKYYKEKGGTFDIGNAYTAIESNVEVKFKPFIDVFKFNDNSIFDKKLKIQRGY